MTRLRAILQREIPLRLLFEQPTIARLARQLETLTPERLTVQALQAGARPAVVPLSFAQQRLWFLDQLEGSSPSYMIPAAVRLLVPLNVAALEQSLNAIIARHEALRTSFPLFEGQPIQSISPHVQLQLPVLDVSALPEEQRAAAIQQVLQEEVGSAFDLARGPLLRVRLLRISRQEHVLLLLLHHSVSDGWSLGVLLRELSLLYQAFVQDQPSPLAPLPVQYADYTLWQRESLQGERLAAQLAYWQEQLAGGPALLELPLNRPRQAVQSFQGSTFTFVLPPALLEALKELSQREGVTLFMLMLAGWATLLGRLGGQERLLVGTPIANRTQAQLEALIGVFVNTLVLPCDLSGNPTFRELLQRVREACLGAYAHQDLPFERLVEALQPQRTLSHSPLFQVMFIMQNTPPPSREFAGLRLEPLAVEQTTAKFDLTLQLQESGQGLLAVLEYNTSLFAASTIARMARQWQVLLEGLVRDPEQPLASLSLLTPTEREQLLRLWNPAPALPHEESEERTVHQLVEAQAERTPDAIAVALGEEQLTYGELDRRATAMGQQLRALGVGPEVLVALLETRGSQFLVTVLAIFKAGGGYLPLEPGLPVVRLGQLLQQSGVGLVLVGADLVPLLTRALEAVWEVELPRVMILEHLGWQGEGETSLQQGQLVEPGLLRGQGADQRLAYVLYTSGSTGIPKGVMVHEGGMRDHLFAKIEALELTARDRVAQTASQGFVISVWQFLAALVVGGCVQVFPDEVSHDPLQLLQEVQAYGITILELVPSLLGALEESLPSRAPKLRLRRVILTGEALPPALARRWQQRVAHVPLLNAYGPTECSDDVAHFPLEEKSLEAEAVYTPIGRPIPNMRWYVLNQALNPVPPGVVGELYVGGVGVSRGYLYDAQRTAEVFVPDPLSEQAGTRLYRTGDLARARVDGTLEYVGRRDGQVKVRGYRIELGEIEAVLRKHPAVQEVAAVAREDAAGQKYLVAYLLLHHPKTVTTSDLHNYVKRLLPDYMLPSAFMILETWPLSPNGKLDRRGLPTPEGTRLEPDKIFVAPRNPLEELLATIWADVLRREQRIGIYDDFFELGGHSLLATQVIARVRKVFRVELPLRAVFQQPTVLGMAEALITYDHGRPGYKYRPSAQKDQCNAS